MFLHSWTDVLRTVLVGGLAYLGLLPFVRISGKRTLASMNAFDFVVTVALGSTLATILLSSDVALAEGLAAFATLIGLQFAITWLSVHTDWVPPGEVGAVAARLPRQAAARRDGVPAGDRIGSMPWCWRPMAPSRW